MLRKKTWSMALLGVLAFSAIATGAARNTALAYQDDAAAQAKIASAISAGPAAISDKATILDNELDDAGKFVVLREGSNGWFCFPDIPASPGNDPQCMDQVWLDWNYSYLAGEDPVVTMAGFEYMLQGGSDPSNTDPLATAPAAGEEWVSSPPHVMLLLPGEIDLSAYSTDHHSGQPYVMWAGTPYQHIMMPVAEAASAN